MFPCQVCGATSKPLCCSRCRKAFYCSVKCQKKDWKTGHRLRCQPFVSLGETADMAVKALLYITNETTPELANEHWVKATDEVIRQKNSPNTNNHNEEKDTDIVATDMTRATPSLEVECPGVPFSSALQSMKQSLYFVVEEMIHISRFQLLVKRNEYSSCLDLRNLRSSTKKLNHGITLLQLQSDRGLEFSIVFPRSLKNAIVQFLDETSLQLSLPYDFDPTLDDLGTQKALTNIETINRIQCNSCQHPLLPSLPITRTSELPVGHWDEIADYLICYNGQPVVDFSISSIVSDPSVALQDANVLCLNQCDLAETVGVLPVRGYGETHNENESKQDEKSMDALIDPAATVRGDRDWRDVTIGASVCCLNCSVPLGFAAMESPECFRLLKHRLSIPSSHGGPAQRLSSCASFLAREMVRYAESKAIFTFIVTLDTPHMSFASTIFTKCILLRLVSWDCNIATDFDDDSFKLNFRRYAKIVFEETLDKRAKHGGTWVWGGVDLCCPPSDVDDINSIPDVNVQLDSDRKISTARIHLHEDEYLETLDSLRQGQSLFLPDLAETTIIVKMGLTSFSSKEDYDGLGLTAIPLGA